MAENKDGKQYRCKRCHIFLVSKYLLYTNWGVVCPTCRGDVEVVKWDATKQKWVNDE